MNENETIRLLRECDAGIRMGIDSIEDVMKYVHADELGQTLKTACEEHKKLQVEVEELLEQYKEEGKEPSPMARGMSWVKTNVKLVMKESDATIADLITEGCNMGVKSLSRYLNQYPGANGKARDIAQRLIQLESKLGEDMRAYL